MKKRKQLSWRGKLALPAAYAFLLLGGMSLAYAAGQSRNTALEAEIGKLQAQVNQNEYRSYHNTKSEYEADKERLEVLLEEVREKSLEASSSDAFYLQYQISTYESQIEELEKKLRDAALQEMLHEYYNNHLDLIIEKEEEKAYYTNFQNIWKIKLYEEQLDYLEAAREEADARYSIAVVKRDLGYALETEVLEARLLLDGLEAQYGNVKEEVQYIRSELLVGDISPSASIIPSIQSESYYYKNFLENSAAHKYYSNQQLAYREYGDSFQNFASPSDAEQIARDGAELRANLAQAQKQQYEEKLGRYIHELITAYRTAKEQYMQKNQEKELYEEKRERASVLYEQGEIQYVDLLALDVQCAKLDYEAISYSSQANDAAYRLQHCIE